MLTPLKRFFAVPSTFSSYLNQLHHVSKTPPILASEALDKLCWVGFLVCVRL
jgi:hypothetical protein